MRLFVQASEWWKWWDRRMYIFCNYANQKGFKIEIAVNSGELYFLCIAFQWLQKQTDIVDSAVKVQTSPCPSRGPTSVSLGPTSTRTRSWLQARPKSTLKCYVEKWSVKCFIKNSLRTTKFGNYNSKNSLNRSLKGFRGQMRPKVDLRLGLNKDEVIVHKEKGPRRRPLTWIPAPNLLNQKMFKIDQDWAEDLRPS